MDFATLNDTIPYVYSGKKHLLSYQPYNGITLRMPGRHAEDTPQIGGDFVVCVDSERLGWVSHQFTHDDIFADIEKKYLSNETTTKVLMKQYASVVFGEDPDTYRWAPGYFTDSLHPQTFLYAVQCLAVAEHRRYEKYEKQGGGRYLPARFANGIVHSLWTAADCKAVQRRGRPGVEMLERLNGKPPTLKELAA
jgi:hypothetical protein